MALTLARQAGLDTPIADAVSQAHDMTSPDDIFKRWRALAVQSDEEAET
ncbi:hypothetical protein QBK99_22450 [Corticibacterium sp. UT-5YL-CI-8]|nr:hypothetical protein [Tianweitania sp. UT-5YL-CI-8]